MFVRFYRKHNQHMCLIDVFSDINECSVNRGGCHVNADCQNEPGSYSCTCKTGYSGNGSNCTGISLIIQFDTNKHCLLPLVTFTLTVLCVCLIIIIPKYCVYKAEYACMPISST